MVSVVVGSRLVSFLHDLLYLVFRDAVFFDRSLDLVSFFRIDEDVGRIRISSEDVVCASSYDNAGTFFRDPSDRVELCQEKSLVQAEVLRSRFTGTHGRSQAVQESVLGLLLCRLDHFLGKTGFFGDSVQQFSVVIRYAQFLCETLADDPSAASEFTADCNDFLLLFVFHFVCHSSRNYNILICLKRQCLTNLKYSGCKA